ncbi:MAG: nuclear transport factor 2 family protein [Pseudomonadota bacterium]
MSERRAELEILCTEFLDAFNRNDLDAVMDFFAEDVVYGELNDRAREGKAAIREAFEPQFSGEFGEMRFIEDDTFIDPEAGKVMSSWDLKLEMEGKPMVLRGLDLLEFEGRQIKRKLTYVKAKAPRYEESA